MPIPGIDDFASFDETQKRRFPPEEILKSIYRTFLKINGHKNQEREAIMFTKEMYETHRDIKKDPSITYLFNVFGSWENVLRAIPIDRESIDTRTHYKELDFRVFVDALYAVAEEKKKPVIKVSRSEYNEYAREHGIPEWRSYSKRIGKGIDTWPKLRVYAIEERMGYE